MSSLISRKSYHGEYTRFLNWFCLRGVWKSHNLTYLLKWSINKSKNKCIYFVDCISSEDLMQQFFLWFWKNVLLKISLHFWRFMLASPSNLSLNFFLLCFYYFWAENISEYCRKDKSLGVLSQKFLMMFLVSEVKSSSHVIIHYMIFHMLYYYMINLCNLIGLEQWYFSLIWNAYMWKLQTFLG